MLGVRSRETGTARQEKTKDEVSFLAINVKSESVPYFIKLCRCPACTFENKPRSSICEVCGTMLKAASAERLPNGDGAPSAAAAVGALPVRPPHRLPPIRPMSTMAASGKQESELMDQLREV